MDDVERIFHHLVDVLSDADPERLDAPLEIAEIYQSVLPYRRYRSLLQFDTNQDYEMALLRLLAGEGGFASVDPAEAQRALLQEAEAPNPNPGAFRDFAAAKVYLNTQAVRSVGDADRAYAPPGLDPEPAPRPEPSETPSPVVAVDGDDGEAETAPIVRDVTEEGDRAEEPDHLEPLVELVPDDSVVCFHCREPLPDRPEVKFCPFCGNSTQIPRCAACGTEMEANWRFCITCGHLRPGDDGAA